MDAGVWGLGLVLLAMAVGTCLQGAVGFGMGTVAAPVVAVVDPSVLPGLVIAVALLLTIAISVRERRAIHLRGVGAAFGGRVVGTAVGAVVVAVLAERWVSILVGVVVIAAMALAALGWRPEPNRRNVVVAGATSGLFGTTTGIGGPPMAMVWRAGEHAQARGTLSAFFLAGSALSLVALAVAGELDRDVAVGVAQVLPAVVVGLVASQWLVKVASPGQIRAVGIAVSVLGAVAAVISGVRG
ncbi:sulfite exporter TauE/SafE family protein [Nocardioides bruguierae]|uniref:sulfite exporter TauE/SafE family protein n=1 Tax=Nocardioides bruguierae TaxID=2945102 RepID=UPI00202280E4|nr:sulfite exporter TauE/SafE family protein [Nocardioides bruguierae]MCL8026105.1 sulfite exporter TauE/SafE family protein [Nocardioides bruguierae]